MLKKLQVFSYQKAAAAYNKNIPDDLERFPSGKPWLRFADNNHPFCNPAHTHT